MIESSPVILLITLTVYFPDKTKVCKAIRVDSVKIFSKRLAKKKRPLEGRIAPVEHTNNTINVLFFNEQRTSKSV